MLFDGLPNKKLLWLLSYDLPADSLALDEATLSDILDTGLTTRMSTVCGISVR